MSEGPHIAIRVEGNGFRPGRRYFVLEDGEVSQVPVVCEADFLAWQGQVYGKSRVDHTVISEDPEVIVGTAFQGHDDKQPDSRPMPWRTTVWGGPHHERTWTYTTLGEAKEGHWQAVDLARQAMKQQSSE